MPGKVSNMLQGEEDCILEFDGKGRKKETTRKT
jgi:hypothetical protein